MILLLACFSVSPPEKEKHPASAPRLLRRASLDLRGVLPSLEQLDAVEKDPSLLPQLEASYLEDPRFQDRMVALLAERWHTRIDTFEIRHYDYHLPDEEEFAFEQAVGEEPLRLMAHVIAEDLPWTEAVTADYTLANPLLASLWPLDYPKDGSGWLPARYTDNRPAVGVLATNGLWWRYPTSTFNLSRSRVAAVSRLLTCYDILERPISFSATPALLDPEGTATAIQTVPACVSCHATIEPAAAAMFGFVPMVSFNVDEVETYHPEREPLGPVTLGVEEAWYGTPIDGLAGMGQAIAGDPRFASCAVQTFASGLWRRQVDKEDDEQLARLTEHFVENGLRVKPLLLEILAGDSWQVGTGDEREIPQRMLSPDQLDTAVAEITGFHWTEMGYDQLQNDERGYRVLAGGVNGTNVLRPQMSPGLTWAITVERLAEAAASTVVDQDFSGTPRLLPLVTPETRPGDPLFETQLRRLSWQLFATRPQEEDLQDWQELWTKVEEKADAAAAWKALLTTFLRDPEFVSE